MLKARNHNFNWLKLGNHTNLSRPQPPSSLANFGEKALFIFWNPEVLNLQAFAGLVSVGLNGLGVMVRCGEWALRLRDFGLYALGLRSLCHLNFMTKNTVLKRDKCIKSYFI